MEPQSLSREHAALIARAVLAYLTTEPDGPAPCLARCLVTLALDTEEPPFVAVNDAEGHTHAVYQVRDIGEGKTMLKRRKTRVGTLRWPAGMAAPARLDGYTWGRWALDTAPKAGPKNTLRPEGKKRRAR